MINMEYNVRKANRGDLGKLVEFTISEAYDAEGITKSEDSVLNGVKAGLEDSSLAQYWILEDRKGQIIGNISFVKEWSDWNSGFYWWIQSMYIEPEYRGKGLMNLLIAEIQKQAQSQKALDIRLYVHRENTRAIKAYKKGGFRDSDYVIMTKKI